MIDAHASISEKFLKKWFWLYFFAFIIGPMWYVTKMTLSSTLSVDEVWVLYGIISLITIISAYNDMGMTESLNFFIPKFIVEKRYDKVKTALLLSLATQIITGVSIAWFFYFSAPYLATNYFHFPQAQDAIRIFSLFFFGISFYQVIVTFFVAVQNTFLYKLTEFIRVFFVFCGVLLMISLWIKTLNFLSYAWILGLCIWVIFWWFFFFKNYYKKYFASEKIYKDVWFFKQLVSYALFVVLGTQASTILGQIDMQLIIYTLWTKDAWYYTNYLSLITIPFLAIGPIFWLLFPVFSELNSKGEIDKIRMIKNVLTKNFFIIGISLSVFFFIFSDILAFVFFGEKFLKSWEILRYCIFFLSFNFLLQINFNILSWIGQVTARVKIIWSAIILNIITTLIFIHFYWVDGAAMATGLWWVFIWVFWEWYLGKEYATKIPYVEIIINFLILWVIWSILYNIKVYSLPWGTRLENFISLAIAWCIYWWAFFLINKKIFTSLIWELKNMKKLPKRV